MIYFIYLFYYLYLRALICKEMQHCLQNRSQGEKERDRNVHMSNNCICVSACMCVIQGLTSHPAAVQRWATLHAGSTFHSLLLIKWSWRGKWTSTRHSEKAHVCGETLCSSVLTYVEGGCTLCVCEGGVNTHVCVGASGLKSFAHWKRGTPVVAAATTTFLLSFPAIWRVFVCLTGPRLCVLNGDIPLRIITSKRKSNKQMYFSHYHNFVAFSRSDLR